MTEKEDMLSWVSVSAIDWSRRALQGWGRKADPEIVKYLVQDLSWRAVFCWKHVLGRGVCVCVHACEPARVCLCFWLGLRLYHLSVCTLYVFL